MTVISPRPKDIAPPVTVRPEGELPPSPAITPPPGKVPPTSPPVADTGPETPLFSAPESMPNPVEPADMPTATPASTGAELFPDSANDLIGGMQPFADKAQDVQPEETVQGQLEGILDKNNLLFDWARGQAAQYANSRGLQNTDMAAEASSMAVIGAAMPIAQ